MSAPRSTALYTPRMLAAAVELAEYPFDAEAPYIGHALSRTCGSEITLGCDVDAKGGLANLGMTVKACAVGQASAAIFARNAAGMDRVWLGSMLHAVGSWLKGEAPDSILPGLELLEGARPHLGRHEAILLPWRAAMDALSKAPLAR